MEEDPGFPRSSSKARAGLIDFCHGQEKISAQKESRRRKETHLQKENRGAKKRGSQTELRQKNLHQKELREKTLRQKEFREKEDGEEEVSREESGARPPRKQPSQCVQGRSRAGSGVRRPVRRHPGTLAQAV